MSTQTDNYPKAVGALAPAPKAGSARVHLGYLDGIRALAALYVVVHHMAMCVWPGGYADVSPAPARMLLKNLWYGHYAVSLFIVVSGFCLMLPVVNGNGVLRGGAWLFLRRRARRILPPYYAAIALTVLFILAASTRLSENWGPRFPVISYDCPPGALIANLLLVQDVFKQPSVNGVFWSLAVEWHIYFWFPLLVLAWRKLGGARVAVVWVIATVTASSLLRGTCLNEMFLQYYGLFALGMVGSSVCFSQAAPWPRLRERVPWGLVATGALAALLGMKAAWGAADGVTQPSDLALGVLAMSVMIMARRPGPNLWSAVLGWKPLAFVGTFSYSIYLVHSLGIELVWQSWVRPAHLAKLAQFGALTFIGVPLIVGFCYLFFLAAERPFITKKVSKAPSPESAVVPAPRGLQSDGPRAVSLDEQPLRDAS